MYTLPPSTLLTHLKDQDEQDLQWGNVLKQWKIVVQNMLIMKMSHWNAFLTSNSITLPTHYSNVDLTLFSENREQLTPQHSSQRTLKMADSLDSVWWCPIFLGLKVQYPKFIRTLHYRISHIPLPRRWQLLTWRDVTIFVQQVTSSNGQHK